MFIKNHSKILAIGAHPDDIELSCLGLILRLQKESTSEIYNIICTGVKTSEEAVKRIKEQIGVNKKVGYRKSYFLHERDGYIAFNRDVVNKIEKIVSSLSPDVVLTHSPSDHHQDHLNVYKATIAAVRNSNLSLICYPSLNSKEKISNLYVNIDKYIEKKIRILKLFVSQKQKIYMQRDFILRKAMESGLYSDSKFGESFYIKRMEL